MASTSSPAVRDPRRPAFEAARLRLARLRVHGGTSLRRVFREATRLVARTLDVERVSIWLFTDDRAGIRCSELYEPGRDEHSDGAVILRADFPGYFAALEQRRVIVADDARTHEATRELAASYLEPLGIGSMLDAPIYRGGEVIGVVCHERVGPPRPWSRRDIDFAGSVADSVALQFEGAARLDAEAALHAHQAYLAEVQKMEALGRLCGGVAHDFRNVLTVVLGHAGLIEGDATASPALRAEAARIRAAAERGVGLARDLAAFGRRDSAEPPAVVRAAEVIESFAGILRGAAGAAHPIEITSSAPDGRVLMRRACLERVLLNLVVNARAALPSGGTIRIGVREEGLAGDEESPGHYIVIDVADEGTGMDEATREHIFEPFFTTRSAGEGTGLGLSIAYGLVDQAGGFIHVDSEPGRGTTMSVYLPRVAG